MKRLTVITNKDGEFEMKIPTGEGVKVFRSRNFNELLRIAEEVKKAEGKSVG